MNHQLTKIVATLGPSTAGKEKIRALADAGVNVFRLNFSHGTHETHLQNYTYIREIAKETNRHFSVLADMQGPKLRIGNFKDGKIILKKNQSFRLDMNPEAGDEQRVCLPHPEIFAADWVPHAFPLLPRELLRWQRDSVLQELRIRR